MIRRRFDESYFRGILHSEASCSQRNRLRLSYIRHYMPQGKLLEVGFGQGGLLRLAAQYYDVYGVDISPYAVDAARAWLGDHVRCADISEERLPPAAYNVIATFALLEHLPHPAPAIGMLYEALDHGGVLVGAVPRNEGVLGRISTAVTNLADRTHCSTYTPAHWVHLFEQAGFRHIDLCGEFTVTRNRAFFLERPQWRHLAFNLIFACTK